MLSRWPAVRPVWGSGRSGTRMARGTTFPGDLHWTGCSKTCSRGLTTSRLAPLPEHGQYRRAHGVPGRHRRVTRTGIAHRRQANAGAPSIGSYVPSLSSRGAQRRGDLVPGSSIPCPTRLPRFARNDGSSVTGYASASTGRGSRGWATPNPTVCPATPADCVSRGLARCPCR